LFPVYEEDTHKTRLDCDGVILDVKIQMILMSQCFQKEPYLFLLSLSLAHLHNREN
jgi:hypothetical protein